MRGNRGTARAEALAEPLRALLGERGLSADPDELAPLLVEPRGLYRGSTPFVARPATVEQAAAVVRLCRETGVAIVPQGGNTGLCGGAMPAENGSQLLVSLGRMNRIREIDALNYTMTVEAGCILRNVQAAAEEAERLFPLSLGAEGSCTVGGNISTNAGGINTLRYGNMRELVLGLEAVLPDGRVWNGLRRLRKDNTGYDLKQLFIGGEGTLGLVTAACVKLFPRPREEVTAFAALRSIPDVIELLSRLRAATGDQISAFEYIGRFGIDLALRHVPGVRDPFDRAHTHYALLRADAGREGSGLRGIVEEALGRAFEDGLVLDATIADSGAQANALWRIREAVVEAQIPEGGSIKHDVSVPVSRVADFIEAADRVVERTIPGARPCPFGHVGDGNIHYNVSQPVGADKQAYLARWEELNAAVHDIVHALDGSVSAEHGVGRLKVEEITHYKPGPEIEMMRAVKCALDPEGLMNPGKVVT